MFAWQSARAGMFRPFEKNMQPPPPNRRWAHGFPAAIEERAPINCVLVLVPVAGNAPDAPVRSSSSDGRADHDATRSCVKSPDGFEVSGPRRSMPRLHTAAWHAIYRSRSRLATPPSRRAGGRGRPCSCN